MNYITRVLFIFLICTQVGRTYLYGQSTFTYFERELNGFETIESVDQIDDGFVLTIVNDPSKSDSDPDRRYVIVNNELQVVLDTQIQKPFRVKKMSKVLDRYSVSDFFYDYRYGNYSLNSASTDSLQVLDGVLPRKIYNPSIILNQGYMYVHDATRNKERVCRHSLSTGENKSFKVDRIKKRTRVSKMYLGKISNSDEVCFIWNERSKSVDDVYIYIWNDLDDQSTRTSFSIEGKSIQHIRIRQVDEGQYVLSGTYGKINSIKANGAFVAFIEDGSITKSSLYPFSALTHYFDYLDQYQKEDLKRKFARLKKHEKSTDILVDASSINLINLNHSWFLPIEIFTPRYTDLYGVTRNGNQIVGSPRERVGYDYSHATILRLDTFGELKHDYFIPFYLNYLTKDTRSQLQYCIDNDTLLLGYSTKNKFYFGDIKPLEFEKLRSDTVFTDVQKDVVRSDKRFYFIDSSTIVEYGYQTIKKENILKKRSEVFYMEKRKLR